jgi:apolipoprotein N-acyltransferase
MITKAKILIRVLAMPIGFLGFSFLLATIATILGSIVSRSVLGVVLSVWPLSLAFCCMYVVYKSFFKPEKKSIRHLCAVYSLGVMFFLSNQLRPICDEMGTNPESAAIGLLPAVIGILIYKVSSRLIIKFTEEKDCHNN